MPYPNSRLRILYSIPWDDNYVNVRRFTSLEEQYEYMVQNTLYDLTSEAFSYVRSNGENSPIRVELSEAQLLPCNYLMFQNTDYSNKWFYAFIERIEYVSDGRCDIYFKLDLFQTWYFQFDLQACLVEREHVNDDTIGANTINEGLATGPYVVRSMNNQNYGGLYMAFMSTTNSEGNHEYNLFNNVFSGMYRFKTIAGDVGAMNMNNMIQTFITNGYDANIVTVFMYPALADGESDSQPGRETFSITKPYDNIDGYVPKNKKLFTYPYIGLVLSNNSGLSNELKYELFEGDSATFENLAVALTMPEAYTGPINYRGLERDFDNGVNVKNFPQCAFAGDTFAAWWAQNKNAMMTAAGTSAISGIISGAISGGGIGAAVGTAFLPGAGTAAGMIGGAIVGGLTSLWNSASSAMVEAERYKMMPDSARGQVQTQSLQAGIDRCSSTIYQVNIRAEYAKRIDDYFSQFGYKVNRVKYPNTSGRKSWNYVKTIGANVEGAVPIEAKKLFETILDRGVTFWHTNDVGNYSLDNSIV